MSKDTLLEFPCEFPIKVMGYANDDFSIIVLDIIRKHIDAELAEDAFKLKQSKSGKYHAVTVRIQATSKTQLDAIYQELTKHPEILMAF